jgi:hypothetical protein
MRLTAAAIVERDADPQHSGFGITAGPRKDFIEELLRLGCRSSCAITASAIRVEIWPVVANGRRGA